MTLTRRMLQLWNSTSFPATMIVLPDHSGSEQLVVVVKCTFQMHAGCAPSSVQQGIILTDQYWGEPAKSSLRYPTDVHPGKRGTDVVVNGDARPPGNAKVTSMAVAVCVGGRTKRAHVIGDRVRGVAGGRSWTSKPKPFESMPLRYERTHGGLRGGSIDPWNPVGVGEDAPMLPNIVVDSPSLGDGDQPVGFGPIAPSWRPRADHVGTYDLAWKKGRAPFLPLDFDARYYDCAVEELTFPANLRGGERVVLEGLASEGVVDFELPSRRFTVSRGIAGDQQFMEPVLDRVVLEPTEARFIMVWRATEAVDGRVLEIDYVEVSEQ